MVKQKCQADLSPMLRKTAREQSSHSPRGPWTVTTHSGFWAEKVGCAWDLLIHTQAGPFFWKQVHR